MDDASGAEFYQCNLCSSKYGTKKAIKTHITTKHKKQKKNDEKEIEPEPENKEDNDFEFETDEGTFGPNGEFVPSTSIFLKWKTT